TSYADYALFEVVDLFKTIDSTILDAVPLIKTFYYRMSNRPNSQEKFCIGSHVWNMTMVKEGGEKKSIEMEWQNFHVFFFVIFAALVVACDARRRCKCENGGRCVRRGTMCLCKAGGGYFGDRCELPCVDIYNSCKNWKEQGRCSYRYGSNKFFLENCPVSCRECTYNPQNAPKGVPLAPVLRPLKGLIGKWRAESDGTYRYPLPFSSTSGYVETIEVSIAKLPAFDTPYLLYSSTAKSKGKDGNIQSDLGFLWLKTKQNVTKIANMFTTNTGES
uniref:Uncharacterized protein n=1 Tax=Romanomermis culicivorax TaxID=13658 RepID=A0A915ISM2_ROMCU